MNDTNPSLEERLQTVEDRLAIYNLLATHPLSADTGDATFINSIYAEDAIFDRGEHLPGARGRESMLALVKSAAHQEAIAGGLAHFGNLPLVELHGDQAFATSYIMIITPDHEGAERKLANHGNSTGYRIHRLVANRWTLERVEGSWRIKERKIRFHDGSDEVREVIGHAKSLYADTAQGYAQ
ncbi:MAG: nuclear transport factor 2 family protein [Polynucleobacter sp.]|nr:nuclear transport factor 2 family protein [Polynucleobacter sp.]